MTTCEHDPAMAPISPALELPTVLALAEGDTDLLAELVEVLCEEAPRLLSAVQASLAARDADGVARAAHRLRGTVSCFGNGAAWSEAGIVETAARRGDLLAVEERLDDLAREVGRLDRELRALVDGAETAP